MRTPSMTSATISATMKKGMASGRIGGYAQMRAVAMRMTTVFKGMLPPTEREISSAAGARSGGPGLGNLERVAIDCGDVEDLSGLAGRAARDLGIPLRVPVLHARLPRAPVDPG